MRWCGVSSRNLSDEPVPGAGKGRPPLPGIYGRVATEYLASGIGVPVPLPVRRKGPPPRGYTGAERRSVTRAQVRRWQRDRPRHNVALVLAEGVIGIDVDAYDGRSGADTIRRLEERYGHMPPTVRSSAREDGVSGINLYRCPLDLMPPGDLRVQQDNGRWTGNVEIIRPSYRYLVCAPSQHPLGMRYRWFGPDGERMDLPVLRDLAVLPEPWVTFLASSAPRAGPAPQVAARRSLRPPEAASEVLSQWASRVAAKDECRNIELNRAAFALGGCRELSDDEITATLLQAAAACGLDEREAVKTIASGLRSGRRRPLS